jgi:drug/metabolite transporter (DMT)-like permease
MDSIALVAAESIMALTPIAIKKTPVDHLTALWSRILTAAVIGYLVSKDKILKLSELGAFSILGYTNLLHISASYESFRHLPAGQAMSILYTYPLWILFFNSKINGESFSPKDYTYIGLASIGALCLNYNPGETVKATSETTLPHPTWGIFTAIIAAITEAGMHVLLKYLGWTDPGKSVWVVSSSAASWLLLAIGIYSISTRLPYPSVTGSYNDFWILTAFHGFSTFAGYYLRFYAIPRLSTLTYSILSFSGLLASYLYGLLFLKEMPGLISLLGAAFIIYSGINLTMVK